jgi:acetolactate synthase-1/2/3 large subunit
VFDNAIDETVMEIRQQEKAASTIIRTLEHLGIDTIFGIPGVHTLALYDALFGSSSIRHILARHEQGAGFMADGYARATGRPGVALVITGPGVTNIATPIGQAYTDSSSVVVLSTNVERAYLDGMRGSLHDLRDQPGLMATITKWNARVIEAEQAGPVVAAAVARALGGRPQPVHVEIAKDVLDEPNDISQVVPFDIAKTAIDRSAIATAARLLAEAKKPAIYAGGGVISANASSLLTQLADSLNAPVLNSIQGKGAIAEDHPLSLGALWASGNPVDDLARQVDCLLVVGSKLGVQETDHFTYPLPAQFIRIDIDQEEMTRNASPSVEILGDAADALSLLNRELGTSSSQWTRAEIQATRTAAEAQAFGADRIAWIDAIRAAVPRDGIVAWDMTMMSYVACGLYPVQEPRTWMFPQGFGTLGFALPAAIGAKIAKPDTAVACVVGDGGFQFTMQEIATAVQYNIGLPVIIFNDSAYSAVKDEQNRERDGRFIAVDLKNPDYVKLAAAYDIPGIRVTSPEILETEIRAAFKRSQPTILDVPIPGWV